MANFIEALELQRGDDVTERRGFTFMMGCPGCGELIVAATLLPRFTTSQDACLDFLAQLTAAYKAEIDAHQALCMDEGMLFGDCRATAESEPAADFEEEGEWYEN